MNTVGARVMPALLTGQFGRYRILKKLGEGGMGAVYLAEDTNMRRKVALKIPNFDGKENQTILDRFYREARVAADIRHPGVCTVYDVACVDGIHHLTMAYIEGTPLADIVRGGSPWPVPHAVALTMHIADSLGALHARGIIHRDLKPGNIMIEPSGRPVLLDFGLARSIQASSQMLTADGNSLGTPAYMAPEQVSGKAESMGPWTDVYPLGVILFQLLTGRLPFQPGTMAELYALLLYGPRPRPSQFGVNVAPDLDLLCQMAIAIEPRQRPPSMAAFIEQLQRTQTPLPVATAPVTRAEPPPLPSAGYSTTCPACKKRVRVSATMTGKRIVCPGCRQVIPAAAPLAPVMTLEEIPEMTEPIQARRPTLRTSDTVPTRDRTERRPATVNLPPRRRPQRQGGGMGWVVGVLAVLVLIPLLIGVGIWAGLPGDNATTKATSDDGNATQTGPAKEPGRFTNSVGVEMVWIPPGTFVMGTPADELGNLGDEGPQHEVEISRGFYCGVFEVTQEQYKKVMGSNPSLYAAGSGNAVGEAAVLGLDTQRLPAENMSVYAARQFCQTLNDLAEEKQAKRRYRLPTEAEWEYACRGGSKTYQPYSTGATLEATQANYDQSLLGRPVAVDAPGYAPNGFGLYHMHGNVYEWCEDRYDAVYYGTCRDQNIRRDPPGPKTGDLQTLRGGSWVSPVAQCRSGARLGERPDGVFYNAGFRVVCEKVP